MEVDRTHLGESAGDAAPARGLTSPIPPETAARIEEIAQEFGRAVARGRRDPVRRRAVEEMSRLGGADLLAVSVRRAVGIDGAGELRSEVAANLERVRDAVEDLRAELTREHPSAGRVDGQQRRVEESLSSLADASRQLEQELATLAQEQQVLATQVQMLERYAYMAQRMEEIVATPSSVTAPDPSLLVDVVLPLRERRADLLTQLTVALQASAALGIVEQNYGDLLDAIRTASGTTMAALRTAVVVGEALRVRGRDTVPRPRVDRTGS